MSPIKIHQLFIELIRISLGTGTVLSHVPDETEWKSLYQMACRHSLAGLILTGVGKLTDEERGECPRKLLYQWIAQATAAENIYHKHLGTIARLASTFSPYGINMMVLKGYGLSLCWPEPQKRACGDIDIILFHDSTKGEKARMEHAGKLADDIVKREGIQVKQNEDKHSKFIFEGISVENHAMFIDTVVHPKTECLEEFLANEAKNTMPHKMMDSYIYLPSVQSDALFIPYHMAGHFVHGEASMRQLVDWACFVMRHGKEINWKGVEDMAREAGFIRFLCCLNGIVADVLGVDPRYLPKWERDKRLEKKMMREIVSPKMDAKLSLPLKVVRFFQQRWKYRLVYREGMLITAVRQARSYVRTMWNDHAISIWDK